MLLSWKEFKKGKTKKLDVKNFKKDLVKNLLNLHYELISKTYLHSTYHSFYIQDPKLRYIHKATVKDRVLHHAIFRMLYSIFDKTFIFDSYSCRIGKGTHRAVNQLNQFARKVSQNYTKPCFVLKCDIRKFFDSIDHTILMSLVKRSICDEDVIWLIGKIIESYDISERKGIPMGNIISQLFANIYMNEFDQFAKHHLKEKYYIRYCDDFLILSTNETELREKILHINHFLRNNLRLSLHPNKIFIQRYHAGIDFLGYISFNYYRALRIKTKKRMLKRLRRNRLHDNFNQSLQSYLGMLKHCDSYNIKKEIEKI